LTARGASATTADHDSRAGSDSVTEPLALRGRRPRDIPLLTALQPNILRPHVRESLRLLLIRIEDAALARASLARIARNPDLMKSAAEHFDEVDAHRSSGADGSAFVGIALSRPGYERLGIDDDRQPPDLAFREGMSARAGLLQDPDPRGWDYPPAIDMILLVGSHDAEVTAKRLRLILAELDGVRIVADETGMTLRNEHDAAIEHFGYVDGRSQPLFVREDAERERELTDGTSVWDPLVALDRVLVRDPGVPDTASAFGSYLVYRKLTQNVQAFDANERRVARLLDLSKEDEERAGAMLVGRFEDGTPVAIQSAEGSRSPTPNNYTYADDEPGTKCPHFAHIRMMNDRSVDPHRRVVIARRGQTYGARPDIGRPDAPLPSGGVGLLFMAVVSDIHSQFEALQQAANGDKTSARDPVIGQGAGDAAPMEFPLEWASSETRSLPDALTQAVRMRGGGYFFLPSMTFLQRLDGGS
jgi:Dyp-type peroxidase family